VQPPFAVLDIDLNQLKSPVSVPDGFGGAAVIIRRNGRLAGFHLSSSRADIPLWVLEADAVGVSPAPERLAELPAISVVVCTRNRPVELERSLRSIVEVCGGNSAVDILVIDNAPQDDATERVVRQFPGIRYVLEPRAGLSFARNRAIAESSGEWIAYTDDDVVLDRGWLNGLREAYTENPDVAAYTGPILPYELDTEAQILFEGRGGLGHGFQKVVYSGTLAGAPFYPCGEACIGTGANMVLRRDVLLKLGCFDEALGAGMPSQSGEDHDLLYRLIRAGYRSAFEPQMAIFHQHRRDMAGFRRQVGSWSAGTAAYMLKAYSREPQHRRTIAKFLVHLGVRKAGGLVASLLGIRRYPWPAALAFSELKGYFLGMAGAYERSVRAAEQRNRVCSIRKQQHETATML
jgi:GT2 family glycosyltransferase